MLAYRGRFAPSPTGPLHAGSLVAALASWLDARAAGGQWLVRVEDVDTERCQSALGTYILNQLAACQLLPDEAPMWQTQRTSLYAAALDQLAAQGMAYPCGCTRKEIDAALAANGQVHTRHGERVYPGNCRHGLHGKPARAWRFASWKSQPKQPYAPILPGLVAIKNRVTWTDRRLGLQQQDVVHEVGDFVLRRADGPWAYQLAVVVDDADQGITHIVRGEDLADNTPRQILLQEALGAPRPQYLHTPLVLAADGQKLSKQNGAQALALDDPLAALTTAAQALGLPASTANHLPDALHQWVGTWRHLYNPQP